jgi:hypothetical protein
MQSAKAGSCRGPGRGSQAGQAVAEVPVIVQCGSAGQEPPPIRFRLNDRDLFVEELLDRWWGDGATYFKLRADDDNFYILKHRLDGNHWVLDSLAPKKTFSAGR